VSLAAWLPWLTSLVIACAVGVAGVVLLVVVQAHRISGLDWRLRQQQQRLDALATEQARARAAHELRRGRRRT
jgi:Flp pilus assembly protein protease CpaA